MEHCRPFPSLPLTFLMFAACIPSVVRLEQSSNELYISGTGLKGEPKLNFDPPIWAPNNYTLELISDTQLKLTLAQGSKWRSATGALFVKGINVGDGDVSALSPSD